ncbi:MAG TPA: DUF4301 domain-containing protein [Bacteroidales bacterium]|nr:DUF4301 domain-containing protein [Bacteroidales bacterium]
MFNELDLTQFELQGINVKDVNEQIENFKQGFPFMQITEPATVGNGIIKLECDEIDDLIDLYKEFDGTRVKFVPASGAATRMFKHLFEFMQDFPVKGEGSLKDKGFNSAYNFFTNIQKFPFYSKLYDELWSTGYKMDELLERKYYPPVAEALLAKDGLNYGELPKGLILFHKYDNHARTALEEQLVEGAQHCKDSDKNIFIYLTVSSEHRTAFEKLVEKIKEEFEEKYEVKLNIYFSEQKISTNTIAVEMDNTPFRNSDGTLLFRPGGHGALLENLNEIDAELIFIKNIDNVVPDRLKPHTVRYKKAIAGLLLSYTGIIFDYIDKISNSDDCDKEMLLEVLDFTKSELCILPPKDLNLKDCKALKSYILRILNRPIRVCGMVKNQGEPGGGPFWAVNSDGTTSLQIVESSQIDLKNPLTKSIFQTSTHFNPVDLVCFVKDYQGDKFDLLKFRDPKTGFISIKSKDGRDLKAQELPGLWNGAMSNWNTIFVEVPLITFNPVKTVNDLLREEHQVF